MVVGMATAGAARAGARARLRRVTAAILERKDALRAELGRCAPLEGLCASDCCEAPSPAEWRGYLRTRVREPTIEALEAERDALTRLFERLEALQARRDALEEAVEAQRAAWVERQQTAVGAGARLDARTVARDRRVTRAANAIARQRAERASGLAALRARFGATIVDDARASAPVDASVDATLTRCLEDELAAETAAAREALASDEARVVREWAEWSKWCIDDATTTLASPASSSRTALQLRHAALHARTRDVKAVVDDTLRLHDDAALRLVLGRLRECLQHSAREHARLEAMADADVEAATYDAIVVGPVKAQYAAALRRTPDGPRTDAEVAARIDADALAPLDDAATALDAKLDVLAQLRAAQAELQWVQERWGCDVALADALANRALGALVVLSARADADADADVEALARAHANALVLSTTWSDANHRSHWGVDEAVRRVIEWTRSTTTTTTTGTSGATKERRNRDRAGHAPLPSLATAAAAAAAACRRATR